MDAFKGNDRERNRGPAPSYNPVETGRAWTHGFLNQKPWHPLSYRNQWRKYEAEQKHLELERKKEAAKKELKIEEEHYRSLTYLSNQDVKEYRDRQQLAFMYVKPPGLTIRGQDHLKREPVKEEKEVVSGQEQTYRTKGPMFTMLKGRALCEESRMTLHMGLHAPHGGFDPKADNQQLIFSDDDEKDAADCDRPQAERRRHKKKRLKDRVKRAEEILSAAGYDVKAINKEIKRGLMKKKPRNKIIQRSNAEKREIRNRHT